MQAEQVASTVSKLAALGLGARGVQPVCSQCCSFAPLS